MEHLYGISMEHFLRIGLRYRVEKDRQTNKHTNAAETLPTRLPSAWVMKSQYNDGVGLL